MSFNHWVIDEFRANAGKVGGPFEGGDLLLLTTTGARSGRPHTVPLGYVRDGDTLLVIGSAGGADRHPAWFHNVRADPAVRVELGSESFPATAAAPTGPHRDELFALAAAAEPGYADYQAGTTRVIPVVVLTRAAPLPAEAGGRAANPAPDTPRTPRSRPAPSPR